MRKKRFGCDTVAAFSPENIFYLTGFWGEGIAITNEERKTILITPRLETERAINTSSDCDVVTAERGGRLISHFVSAIKNKKTCIDCLDHSIFETLKQRLNNPRGLLTNNQPFFDARMIKDEKEISTISKAAAILDKLYEICTERIKEGLSERRLQAILIYQAMKLGASPPSYRWTLDPLIIASGPNGAQPHAQISDRKFKSGDMIIVDLTLRHKGYIADATRTFGLGTISTDMKKYMRLYVNLRRLVLRQCQKMRHAETLIIHADKLSDNQALTNPLYTRQDMGLVWMFTSHLGYVERIDRR